MIEQTVQAAGVAMLILATTSAVAKETLVHDVAEFDAAVKAAQPGDEIILADGEWRDADLLFRAAGTPQQRITLRAQTPGKVELTGTSRLRFGGERLTATGLLWPNTSAQDDAVAFRVDSRTLASHCTLEQCAILGDAPDKERKWVSIYGESNSVSNCRFENKQSGGTLLVVWLDGQTPGRHLIYANFFGPRSALGKNGGEIIRVGDSKTSLSDGATEVESNYFYHCSGEAEIISNKSCLNSYVFNTFVGCGGALTLRHGHRCNVNFNAFFGDGQSGTGGVRVIGEGHEVDNNLFYQLTGNGGRAALSLMNGIPDSPLNGYYQVISAKIRHNSFIECNQSILVGSSDKDQKHQNLPPAECEFSDNSVITRDRPVFTVATAPTKPTFDANRFHGGELGLADATGWTADDTLSTDVPKKYQLKIDLGPAPPSQVGPEWMRPGDEFLPEVLKPKAAK